MPIRIRIARTFWTRPFGRTLLLIVLALFLVGLSVFAYVWHHFSEVIDARLGGNIFEQTSKVYAAPEMVTVGEALSPDDVVAQLRRFGYSDPTEAVSSFGRFDLEGSSLAIQPGPDSRVGPDKAVRLDFADGHVTRIRSLADGSQVNAGWIDPPLVTNLFDQRRTKRRLVRYEDLPPELIQALVAAEDRRFFSHMGISVIDGLRALWVDIRKGATVQGASTLTMQLSRSFFLTPSRTWKRKAAEAVIALQLERRFSKEKILELYANEVYLGQRGSFTIRGFGEGAQAYFDKDVSQLTLPEAAFLVGLLRGPSRYNPYRNPDLALARRNNVLDAMVETSAVTAAQAAQAKQQPLGVVPGNVEASEAPYFVDLVRDRLLGRYTEEDLISQSYRINTTLDLPLQEAAAAAVRESLPDLDALINQRFRHHKGPVPQAQVALIALDPHTGEVKALIGGRDYARSQLDRAVADRQPGSSFKPFVYAAAFETGLTTPEHALTPVTTVVDEPTVFDFEGKQYEPSNYGEKFFGTVTLRDALIHSLNVATVKVAEMAGYENVAQIALAAGMNPRLRPTPAMALGAYDSTPLEVARAYTVFANGGSRVEPTLIDSVEDNQGRTLQQHVVAPTPVLDPRVAYLVVDLMEDNINRGTGVGARSRGFTAPAAGKTGTSRDGWFIGFTSNLLCVVWVGFDDGRDLGLPGSAAALPIWTNFMKRAVAMPAYSDTEEFIAPEGIVSVPIDPETLQVATPECPEVRVEKFILGTEPHDLCPKHRPSLMRRFTRTLLRGIGVKHGDEAVPPARPAATPSGPDPPPEGAGASAGPPEQQTAAPRNPLSRFISLFHQGKAKSPAPAAKKKKDTQTQPPPKE